VLLLNEPEGTHETPGFGELSEEPEDTAAPVWTSTQE
jgi:hypothetical protein